MTAAQSQDEILGNTRTVVQGLEALRGEHVAIRATLLGSLGALRERNEEATLIEEKSAIVENSLQMIQLGIEEAQVA